MDKWVGRWIVARERCGVKKGVWWVYHEQTLVAVVGEAQSSTCPILRQTCVQYSRVRIRVFRISVSNLQFSFSGDLSEGIT